MRHPPFCERHGFVMYMEETENGRDGKQGQVR